MAGDGITPPAASGEQHERQPRASRRRKPRRRRPTTHHEEGVATLVDGLLFRKEDGKTYLLDPQATTSAGGPGVLVDDSLASSCGLESGVLVAAKLQARNGRHRPTVVGLESVEGLPLEEYRQRVSPFAELLCIDPLERFHLETDAALLEPRAVELIAPIGRGQRCLIVAPPKAGKTILLQQLAHAIATNHPETHIFVLLVDERPEEVTDWKRTLRRGEVWASSTDKAMESHIEVSELVLERARRLVELGEDVVVFVDSLTRMSRAYNNAQKSSGRIMSGGIDARTMAKPRRFFGSARNLEDGGSLTIVATCLVDTGSRMDEVIFQEFKGTGNTEIILSHELFDRRVFPCIHISASGTRKEEKLYPRADVEKIFLLRRALAALSPTEAMLALLGRLKQFRTNAEFLDSIKAPNGRG
ncbi:MAG: transcription termination factor Rho [Acidobacteriota bacterium]